jgi:hypothetical protein
MQAVGRAVAACAAAANLLVSEWQPKKIPEKVSTDATALQHSPDILLL